MTGKESEEIKERLDIVDIISEYIQLNSAGMDNFKALCPFHNEKTSSFMVSRSKQIFKCFGCGEGGDIFSFVMKMDGLEFVDALRLLAKKAGVEMKNQNPEFYSKRARAMDVLSLAAEYYHQALLKSKSGQVARDYIKKRGLSDLTVDGFKLGFAPDDWEMLSRFLKSKGFKDDEILASGMVGPKARGGYYDRFRFRLMFPIWNAQGNVVGFTARALREDEKMGKYINTPQSLVYDKSRVLYGLDKAKAEIRREDKIVIVEGNMDVVASHQAGVKNVVASSGTALAESQINLIKRYTENLIFAFDMDAAGDTATQRGIDLAVSMGMNVRVVVPEKGGDVKDPDDIIKNKGVKIWKKVIKNAKSVMDYYFENTVSKLDLKKVDDKKIAAKFLLPKIRKIPDKVEQTHYLQRLGDELGVGEDVLRRAIVDVRVGKSRYNRLATPKTQKNMPVRKSEKEMLQERLFGLVMALPECLDKLMDLDEKFLSEQFIKLYKKIKEYYNNNKSFDFNDFANRLEKKSEDLAMMAKEFVLAIETEESRREREDNFDVEEEVGKCVIRLKELDFKKRLNEIGDLMKEAEKKHDQKEIDILSKQFGKFSQELNKIYEL